jgi:hypothetical protein
MGQSSKGEPRVSLLSSRGAAESGSHFAQEAAFRGPMKEGHRLRAVAHLLPASQRHVPPTETAHKKDVQIRICCCG